MSLASTLNKTMNTPEIQSLIAESWLTRDTSLVALDKLLTNYTQLGVIVADLDKSIAAKKHGLSVKKKLVQEVKLRCASFLKNEEILLSLGNDEFLVILPNCGGTDLLVRADDLRKQLADELFPIEETGQVFEFPATVSMGVVEYPSEATSAPDLYGHGLLGCYLAKERGRNQVASFRDAKTSSVQWNIYARYLIGIESLAAELDRSVEDIVNEALEALLRRYHRT